MLVLTVLFFTGSLLEVIKISWRYLSKCCLQPLIDWWFSLKTPLCCLRSDSEVIMLYFLTNYCMLTKIAKDKPNNYLIWGLCKKSMKWASFTVILGHAKRSLGQCFFLVDEGHLFVPFKFWRKLWRVLDGLLGLKLRMCFQLGRKQRVL